MSLAIVGKWLVSEGIANMAFFHDIKKKPPVLALSDGWHEEFLSKQLGIVNSSKASHLVVSFQHTESDGFWGNSDTNVFVILVTYNIRCA